MPKDDATLLNFSYIVFGFLIALVGWHAIHAVGAQTGWDERYNQWFPLASQLGAAAFGIGTVFGLRMSPERHEYFLSSVAELRKVTWPTAEDTRKMTTVVVIVVAIFAVILFVFDLIWSEILKLLLAL